MGDNQNETYSSIRKNDKRDDRLAFSNYAEHTLRRELNSIAMKKCDEFTRQFGECSREQGLLVIFKCRNQLNALNGCLKTYNSDEEFEKYKLAKEQELKGLP